MLVGAFQFESFDCLFFILCHLAVPIHCQVKDFDLSNAFKCWFTKYFSFPVLVSSFVFPVHSIIIIFVRSI